MRTAWRITALTVLVGLLALPVLGLAAGDSCCAGAMPCAPAGAPCTSLGAPPCCATAGGSDATTGAGLSGPALLAPQGAWHPLAAPGASLAGGAPPYTPSCRASSLQLSVVLRI